MTTELISKCQKGDRQAMGMLYTSMHDELLAVCRRYVHDPDTAEDLLHDSFLLIFSKIGELRQPEKATGWMHTVVRNVALFYLGHRQQHAISIDDMKPVADPDTPASSGVTFEELMTYVDALPEGYRKVFRLSVLEGLSHQQIADMLHIEPHSSSSQLYRAKSLLRQSLRVLLLSLLTIAVPVGLWQWLKNDGRQVADNVTGTETSQTAGNGTPPPTAPIAQNEDTPPTAAPTKVPTEKPIEASASSSMVATAGNDTLELPPQTPAIVDASQAGTDAIAQETGSDRQPAEEDSHHSPLNTPHSPLTTHHSPLTTSDGSEWSLQLAYSGLPTQSGPSLPYGEEGMNAVDSTTHHKMPLTVGLDVSYRLDSRWSLNAGLRYTLLSSKMQSGNTYLHADYQQRVRYAGISLGTTYQFYRYRRWSLYGSASATLDLPLHSTTRILYIYDGSKIDQENLHLHPDAQWSLGAGIGLHYRLAPTVGFFAEPSLHHYFPTGDGIDTWRTDHPVSFSLPVGLRITF